MINKLYLKEVYGMFVLVSLVYTSAPFASSWFQKAQAAVDNYEDARVGKFHEGLSGAG
jgi:hypothetical protein